MKTYKDQSREGWYSKTNQDIATGEQIQIGCLQRIADATEAMAKNYNNLLSEIESLKHWKDYYRDENNRKYRTISALRGVITKLKKKPKR